MNCHVCGTTVARYATTCQSCKTQLAVDGGEVLTGLLAIGGLVFGSIVAAKVVKKGFAFLRDNVDWESLGEEIIRALEQTQQDIDSIKDNRERLARVERLLEAEDSISVDQAAMLLSATFEAGLKNLSQARHVQQSFGENEGMVEIGVILKDQAVISGDDLRGIKSFAYRIRNPVVHGEFGKLQKSDVMEQLGFVRGFLVKHGLINTH